MKHNWTKGSAEDGRSCTSCLKFSLLCFRSKKPPPLHTVADWKVVLHLPEIETWLRATSDRVTQLTHSVSQDSESRHVDVHLVQLKVNTRYLLIVFQVSRGFGPRTFDTKNWLSGKCTHMMNHWWSVLLYFLSRCMQCWPEV